MGKSDVEDILGSIHEAEKEAGINVGGGGALFCKAHIEFGFKVFATGQIPHEKTFIPLKKFPPRNDAEKKAFKALYGKAVEVKNETGCNSNPALSYCISIEAADVIGKQVNWQFTQHKIVPNWKRGDFNAFEELVIPRLVELELMDGGEQFVRIAYVRDQGNPGAEDKPNFIWLPVEKFKNEKECRDSATEFYAGQGTPATADSGIELPEGWDDASWLSVKDDVDKILTGTGPLPARIAKVVTDFGFPKDWVTAYHKSLS